MYYTKLRLAIQDLVELLRDREDLLASCRSMSLGAQYWAMTTVDRIEKEIEASVSRISKLKKEEQKEEQKEDSDKHPENFLGEEEILNIFDQILQLSNRDCAYLHDCLIDGRVRSVDGVKHFISKVETENRKPKGEQT